MPGYPVRINRHPDFGKIVVFKVHRKVHILQVNIGDDRKEQAVPRRVRQGDAGFRVPKIEGSEDCQDKAPDPVD